MALPAHSPVVYPGMNEFSSVAVTLVVQEAGAPRTMVKPLEPELVLVAEDSVKSTMWTDEDRPSVEGENSVSEQKSDTKSETLSEAQNQSFSPDSTGFLGEDVFPDTMESIARHGAGVEVRPLDFENPAPVYPGVARRRGWEGTVILQVRVESDGHPAGVTVLESSGYSVLDEEAVRAIRTWRFEPARRGTNQVSSMIEIPVRFRLVDSSG